MTDLSPDTIPELVHGWTRERKAQFLDHLARHGNVRAACSRVGLSREAAYKLRRRDGQFARGWAAALVLAHEAGLEVLADRAIEGVEEPIWYRGELVGTRRKYDSRLLLALIARLDKLADDKAAKADAARFDELVASIAGQYIPERLQAPGDGVLPLDRQEVAREAAAEAEERLREAAAAESGEEPDEEACIAVFRAGHQAGQAVWDMWFADACDFVDYLAEWDAFPEPELDSDTDAEFGPRTVSDVSTCAIAASPPPGPAKPDSSAPPPG